MPQAAPRPAEDGPGTRPSEPRERRSPGPGRTAARTEAAPRMPPALEADPGPRLGRAAVPHAADPRRGRSA
eukprot:5062293-Alexandrium_andersonii.AAC.1